MPYKHILLATDLSYCGHQAADRACSIASELGARLSIVHVMEHPSLPYDDVGLKETLEEKAKNSLAAMGQHCGVPPSHQHLAVGSVKAAISDITAELQVDLIVVGIFTLHGLDALLGSHTESILNAVKCDVLAVRLTDQVS